MVTGAAGFIGSHAVDRLLADGCDVLGIDNYSTGKERNLVSASQFEAFQLERADIADPGVMNRIVGSFRPQAVIHLAALVSVPKAEADPALN
jgi:UDP-glucose 4-epimerase